MYKLLWLIMLITLVISGVGCIEEGKDVEILGLGVVHVNNDTIREVENNYKKKHSIIRSEISKLDRKLYTDIDNYEIGRKISYQGEVQYMGFNSNYQVRDVTLLIGGYTVVMVYERHNDLEKKWESTLRSSSNVPFSSIRKGDIVKMEGFITGKTFKGYVNANLTSIEKIK